MMFSNQTVLPLFCVLNLLFICISAASGGRIPELLLRSHTLRVDLSYHRERVLAESGEMKPPDRKTKKVK